MVEGSAAQRAGLQPGDRLLKVNGIDTNDGATLRSLLVRAESPVLFELLRSGQETPESLLVELNGSPSRVGVSWRIDDAEPDSVVIVRVIPGSPAYEAGLKVGDRLCRVAGEPVQGSASLVKLLASLEGETPCSVERSGRIQTVKLGVQPLLPSAELPPQAPPAVTAEASDRTEATETPTP